MERDGCFCTVVDTKSQARYVCCCRTGPTGGLRVRVTDGAALWSSDCSEDSLKQLSPRSTEDPLMKVRASCLSGDVSVMVQNSSADLCLGSGSTALSVTLTRMEASLATEELKELLFTMANRLAQLGSRTPAASPMKGLQRCPADFKPRQQPQNGAPVKRRLAGASLINPGTKKRTQATGVAFNDDEED